MAILNGKTVLLMISLTSLIALSSCTWFKQEKSEQPSFVLVNVLSKKYFDDCRIKGSIHVTMDALERYAQNNWDKQNTEIVVYCANYKCTASGEAARMLKNLGYEQVYAYEGGTAEWKHLELPTEGEPCQAGYLDDFEKPAGHEVEEGTPVITAQELRDKMSKHGIL